MESLQFRSIGISYKTAPLEIREQIALNEDEAKALMLKVQEFFGGSDILVVSTCNRTEIYYNAPQDFNVAIAKLLLIEKGLINTEAYLSYFTFYASQDAAARHLFEVATGLHSQVVGDMQIPNQVKHAYQWSVDLGMAGPFLHRLLHTIFFANKRVAQETSFRDGAASTSYVAVELIEHVTTLKENPSILVVGVGEIGTDVCRNLKEKKYTNIKVINRTRAKAEQLALELGFEVGDFENVEEEIRKADVVISSIQRDEPFITKELLRKQSLYSFKYLIDLSVPRSVAMDAEQVPGVIVYNIDNIQQRANEALTRRLASIPQVEAIITQALDEFGDWSKEMVVSPTIQKLKNALEQIRQEELARYMKSMNEDEAAKVDKITSSMMQKILKLPVLQLKAACKRGEAETLIDVLNDLFNLEQQPERK
ncbi:glutamyl-tRNA reductase [Runella salmonicolor]|uniref:Glutamyl-tRNA reductase n=1 Tax=Runella salmonicolor TaxID=2950278 RepID=A0ABT1FWK7_9BACT|nr:glutamyl-tRNA reductase [Runella salmonicolor]MCP1386154.1 glutamyl-tRNA reductase [Runella salmonicolor]